MIDKAILTAVPAHLIEYIGALNSNNCQATPDERPIPVSGDIFVSVYIQEVQGRQEPDDHWFEQFWGFGVTISKKRSAVSDRNVVESIYLQEMTGISDLATKIQFALVHRYEIMNDINTLLNTYYDADEEIEQFVQHWAFINPPHLLNRQTRPLFRNEEWFHGDTSPPRNSLDGSVGLSLGLNFSGMRLSAKLDEEMCE